MLHQEGKKVASDSISFSASSASSSQQGDAESPAKKGGRVDNGEERGDDERDDEDEENTTGTADKVCIRLLLYEPNRGTHCILVHVLFFWRGKEGREGERGKVYGLIFWYFGIFEGEGMFCPSFFSGAWFCT